MSAPRFWFTPAPGYDGPRIELTCGRHRFACHPNPRPARFAEPRDAACELDILRDTIAALDLAGESGLSVKEADEQRDNLVQVVRLLRSEAR